MGMRQRKCPLCKKWRKYEESVGDWHVIGHIKVCDWCAKRWHPIDSAPLDGTRVLVCDDSYCPTTAEWSDDRRPGTTLPVEGRWTDMLGYRLHPKWWMPLPTPPLK